MQTLASENPRRTETYVLRFVHHLARPCDERGDVRFDDDLPRGTGVMSIPNGDPRRRLRARCAPEVRPLAFHCTRQTFATLALEAGRSIKWVADVVGDSDPTITLATYAHALPAGHDALDFVPLEATHANRMQPHAKRRTANLA